MIILNQKLHFINIMFTIEEFEGIYEQFMCGNINTIVDCLNEGDVLVDIGANTGLISKRIMEKVNLSKVILIEPIKPYYEECLRKFEGNPIVEFENIGFSDENGFKKFLCSEQNYGYNKIYTEGMEIHPHFVEDIYCIKFSDWVKDRKINFIKIDAEGHDTNIINGMVEWLDAIEKKPYILFEGDWYEDLEITTSNMMKNKYSYNIIHLGRDILLQPQL